MASKNRKKGSRRKRTRQQRTQQHPPAPPPSRPPAADRPSPHHVLPQQPPQDGGWSGQRSTVSPPLLLALLASALYALTAGFGYVLDDNMVLTENRLVLAGLSAIPELLTTGYLSGYQSLQAYFYRPLSLITFAVEVELWGLRPGLSHGINALLYGGGVALLWSVLAATSLPRARTLATLAATIFAVHPLHLDVVATIKGRDDLLALIFELALLRLALCDARSPHIRWLMGCGVAFFLALLSKESALPFLVVAPALVGLAGHTSAPIKAMGRVFVAAAVALLAHLLLRQIALDALFDPWNTLNTTPLNNALLATDSAAIRISTALLMFGWYMLIALHPRGLVYDYSIGQIPLVGPGDVRVWLVVLTIAVVAWRAIRGGRNDWVAVGVLLFAVPYSTVSNLVVLINGSTMAERYLFVPSVGLAVLLAGLLLCLPRWRVPAAVLVVAYGLTTLTQLPQWRDHLSLIRSDIRHAPGNPRLAVHCGNVITRAVQDMPEEEAKVLLAEGAALLARSLALVEEDPVRYAYLDAPARISMGRIRYEQEDFEGALRMYDGVLSTAPDAALALAHRGHALWRLERTAEAADSYDAAIASTAAWRRGSDFDIDNHRNLARVRYALNEHEAAVVAYTMLIEHVPEDSEAAFKVGNSLFYLGKYDEAAAHYAMAINRSTPTEDRHQEALMNLCRTHIERLAWTAAIEACETVIDLAPADARPHAMLANIYDRSGDDARRLYHNRRAIELDPSLSP